MPTGVISGSRSTSKSDVKDAQSNDEGEQTTTSESIASSLQQLKKRILAERVSYVKEKVEAARRATVVSSNQLLILSKSRHITTGNDDTKSALAVRMENSLCRLGCLDQNVWENEVINSRDEGSNVPSSIIYGSSLGVKGVIQSLKITPVQKIPPYTTWIFLDRNQIMAEDQSVVGRRRIYYDPTGNEALICSDSEEEQGDDEEEKYEFSSGEDKMLWCAIQEHGLTEPLLDNLSQNLEVKPSEIQERYEFLLQNDKQQKLLEQGGLENAATIPVADEIFCGKDLDAAMDSFDNLFCRRCLVFDCRLHGCSQPLVSPSEKTTPWVPPEEDSKLPCGSSCYRLERVKAEETAVTDSSIQVSGDKVASSGIKDGSKTCARRKNSVAADIKSQRPIQSESGLSNEKQAAESSQGDTPVKADSEEIHSRSSEPKKRGRKLKENKINKRTAEQVLFSMRKKQKKIDSDLASSVSGDGSPVCSKSNSKKSNSKLAVAKKNGDVSRSKKMKEAESRAVDEKEEADDDGQSINECDKMQIEEAGSCKMDTTDTNFVKLEKHGWSAIEKGLYAKGVEIFGRNSCLIARNLLYGLKTCSEIAEYMYHIESKANGAAECGASLRSDGSAKGAEVRTRTRLWRRKGRVRRLKYSWKSAGHPLMRKRIADGKDQPCRQYTPCDCQSTCGKQCACLRSGTCCEKYCGCSKVCKNRFRGCHCAKSQCRSRQCPCFAAGRECDPDVCRNCWVGCGDGTLGGPPQRGDNYECRNMKLLLKQQQRVLLGRSDISGWGAFLRNSVNKHDYLGEYTGELISHKEADKRGKIYDRENSSFLFNLNDQYVLDAYRKGDKLKFANHSPSPNCYAKVIMVAGDHRVGIFAKERICGGEELFYDYRYEPDKAPAWARKPEDAVTKRDDTGPSHGRAQKVAR